MAINNKGEGKRAGGSEASNAEGLHGSWGHGAFASTLQCSMAHPQLYGPGDARLQPGARVQTWEVSERTCCKHDACSHSGRAHGPTCWMVHGCKVLDGISVQGTAWDLLELY